jgi:hypothetical protein
VAQAFEHYTAALAEAHPRRRAQHFLLANSLAVLHEQRRLQPYIEHGINALSSSAVAALGAQRIMVQAGASGPHTVVADEVHGAWDEVVTTRLMSLVMPDEVLHVGRDLPPPRGLPLFPPDLAELDLAELLAFTDEWDRTGGTGRPTGAKDWLSLADRMNYIFNLFRSRQQYAGMIAPPFATSGVPLIELG